VFLWTLAHWLLCVASIWIGFRAVGIEAPFSAALFLNGLSSIGRRSVVARLLGVFESVSKVSLQFYGVDPTLAISWALSYHILTFIPITVFGSST
jgi:uncharacterized membrane protein YbhN (UPF0104 family)